MAKETLTMQAIRYDLRKQLREDIIVTGVCAVFFLWFLWSFFRTENMLILAVIPLAFLVATIAGIMEIYYLYSLWKKPGGIVKDRLVGKEIKGRRYRGRYCDTCRLQFASHGEYEALGKHYEWSDLYTMDSNAVYIHAECDDEFYLVLSKPHTGKILLAYNAKMFDYQPPQ